MALVENDTHQLDWFWSLIDHAKLDPEKLAVPLSKMTPEEIIRFVDLFTELAVELTGSPYHEFMGESVTEDSEQDVTWAVVSQGKLYYFDILKHPEKIPTIEQIEQMPDLFGVPLRVFSQRFGMPIDHWIRKNRPNGIV